MGSSSKRRQTFSKMTRERAVKEKRAAKQEKKDERKRLAAEAAEGGDSLAESNGAENIEAEGILAEDAPPTRMAND